MVGMDGKIPPDAFFHLEFTETHHVCEIAGPVQRVVGFDQPPIVVLVPVDDGDDVGQLGQKVNRIVKIVLPIFSLVDSL